MPSPTTRWLRIAGTGLAIAYFALGLLFLVVREVLMPRIDTYRPQVIAALSHAIGLPVAIEALAADWSHGRPRLHMAGLTVHDRSGDRALRLESVDATLAWSSLLRGQAHFHQLVIFSPELSVHRSADGRLFVAGIGIEGEGTGAGFSGWLLGQREIVIRDAALRWIDHQRGAPELRLDRFDFRYSALGGRYRFGMRAVPDASLAASLDIRGDLVSLRPMDPATWAGQVYVALDDADLGAWTAWVDYPVPLVGRGGVRAWADVAGGGLRGVTADVALADVVTQLGEALPPLELQEASGRVIARRSPAGVELATRALEFVTLDALRLAPTNIDLALRDAPDGGAGGGEFRANRLDIAALAQLAERLPLDDTVRIRLAALGPQGRLDDLRFAWTGPVSGPVSWKAQSRFSDIAVYPDGVLPGVQGLSGEIDGDESRGRFRLVGQNASLELPAVFPEAHMSFSMLQAEGGWARREGRLEIALDGASFENPDAAGTASGLYIPAASGAGEIDLTARLTRADGEAVWRYLPWGVGEYTRSWLRRSLSGGAVPDARLRLKGPLDEFPFRDGTSGQFLVTTRVSGAKLDYAEGWPAIEAIDAELRFEGPGLKILAERARIFGVALSQVVAELPDLDTRVGKPMTITGRASGPTAEFLRFVAASPVSARLSGLTDDIRAEGRGTLDLRLVMPLHDLGATTVRGEYRFGANRLTLMPDLPPLTDAAGRLRFTGNELEIPEASGRFLGEPLRLTAQTPDTGGVRFRVEGGAAVRVLRQSFDWPLLEHLSGTVAWQGDIEIGAGVTTIAIGSRLAGLSSSLPHPFNKRAAETWPMSLRLEWPRSDGRERLRVELADRALLEMVSRRSAAERRVERAGLALFAPLETSPDGLMLRANLDEFDVDAWRAVFAQLGPAEGAVTGPRLTRLDARVGRLTAGAHRLANVELAAVADARGWTGSITSEQVVGSFDWRSAGDGALIARLARLAIGTEGGSGQSAELAGEEPPRRLPALDIVAEQFTLRGMDMGRLELQAANRDGLWELGSLALTSVDAVLKGSGRWRPGFNPLTELEFALEADDIGRLLERLGYPEAVRRGRAEMAGTVAWRGAPTRIDYPTLRGQIRLDARDGQFRQLDPGMGRLLGVLSLQSLPRRLTLDFRDVFSEGFAFDRISGSMGVEAGVLRTDDLHIAGPSARIWISGSADVAHETQDLNVTVQPTLSEGVAIGAAAGLINPVAGVIAYLAQKALSDPIERMFAFRYAITGGWADPKVEKLGAESRPGGAANE